jgi:[ribosomal protein S5]-alanine N-acetyltransferase
MSQGTILPLETQRLNLYSLSVEFLGAMAAGDIKGAQSLVDYGIEPKSSLLGLPWVTARLKMIEADPLQHAWMYRAIVRKRDDQMVGFISFHHKAPDPDLVEYVKLGAELGYTIEPQYRRNGYAKESAIAMMEWACRDFGVRDFVLTISPQNSPSLKMAASMGFKIVGEKDDPIDGLELVMRAGIDQIVQTKEELEQ